MTPDLVREFGLLTLGTRLRRLGERLQLQTQAVLAASDLTVPVSHFPLLAALDRHGALSVGSLAEAIGVSQPAVTRQLGRLQADGLVEDIITALSRVKSFFVIARNSSFTYKGRAVDVRQVARELGVRYVLEGSIRKAGSRVRIVGQLVDAITGHHVWADRFDGDVSDIFELQDKVTESVVGPAAPRGQHRLRPGQPQQTDLKGPGQRLTSDDTGDLVPSTQPDQRLGSEHGQQDAVTCALHLLGPQVLGRQHSRSLEARKLGSLEEDLKLLASQLPSFPASKLANVFDDYPQAKSRGGG